MDNPRVDIVRGQLARINTPGKRLILKDGSAVAFDKCCLCTGGRPHLILQHESVMGIHDTQVPVSAAACSVLFCSVLLANSRA
jgi:hypothetical protein